MLPQGCDCSLSAPSSAGSGRSWLRPKTKSNRRRVSGPEVVQGVALDWVTLVEVVRNRPDVPGVPGGEGSQGTSWAYSAQLAVVAHCDEACPGSLAFAFIQAPAWDVKRILLSGQ